MSRFLSVLVVILAVACQFPPAPVQAQTGSFSALARVVAEQSQLFQTDDGVILDLTLSQGVPYRAYTLEPVDDVPPRLVLDFREVDWQGLSPEAFGAIPDVTALRFGAVRPGWSRMVLDLSRPLALHRAGLRIDPQTGHGRLQITLRATSAEDFAARSGAPRDPAFDLPPPKRLPAPRRAWWARGR